MKQNIEPNELVKACVQSFYSPEPYRMEPLRPRRVLLILLLATAVLAIPGYITLVSSVMSIKRNYVDPAVYQLPVMEVINGKVHSTVSQPFRLHVGDSLLFVLDTTGSVNSLDESGAWAFMGSDHFAMYENRIGGSHRRFDFSGTEYLMFDPLSMKQWIDRFLPLFYPLVFIITTGGIYIFRVAQMLAALGVALLVLKARRQPANAISLMTVALFAMIPAMVIELIIMWMPVYFGGKGMIFYLLLAGYMWWGVRSHLQDSGK